MSNVSTDAQSLLDRANNLSTKYFQEFTRVFGSKEYEFIACIEGNDQPYYVIPCSHYLKSNKIYYLRCNGKKNVTELIDILENSDQEVYRKSNCFGLVDRDYGIDFINKYPSRIYETPCYSYENFYLSIDCLKKILESHFNIKKFNDFFEDYERIIENYTTRLSDYISLIKEVDKLYRSSQISAKKYKEGLPSYASAEIIFSPIKITLENVDFENGKNFINCFKKDITSSYSEISYEDSNSNYQHNNFWKFVNDIRGKFLITFLNTYLKKLMDDINNLDSPVCFVQRNRLKKQKLIDKQFIYKVQLNFDNATILSSLAQYADQPDCLKEFLRNFKDQSITMVA
jgi:hypothetical protein